MIRTVAIVFAPALICGIAQAQQAFAIAIVEYGLYTTDKVRTDTTGPTSYATMTNVRHAATTTTVPAQIGVEFGVRASAAPRTEQPEITLFPPPGLKSPKSAQPVLKDVDPHKRKIGDTIYCSYKLDHAREVVPGKWTFQFWSGNRMLAEQSFMVTAQ